MEHLQITEEALQALSRDRAEKVKTELQKRGIDPGRLVVVTGAEPQAANKAGVEIELASQVEKGSSAD